LKNAHLFRFPHPSPFNVRKSTPHGSGFIPLRSMILRIRAALHPDVFEQPSSISFSTGTEWMQGHFTLARMEEI
jgi:hypothetical protein